MNKKKGGDNMSGIFLSIERNRYLDYPFISKRDKNKDKEDSNPFKTAIDSLKEKSLHKLIM